MKKILISLGFLGLVLVSGCTLPDADRPYINGPIYYKQPSCVTYKAFPETYKRWDSNTGLYVVYRTYENVYRTECTSDPRR